MNIEVQEEWYTQNNCLSQPLKIFVFGDNMKRIGNGGQAQIRDCSNSVGVATKVSPSMGKGAFFSDQLSEVAFLNYDLTILNDMHCNPAYEHMTLVFPKDGLGTGLAKLKQSSPAINDLLSKMLSKHFNVGTDKNGGLFLIPWDKK